MMLDKNGVELRTGRVVEITRAIVKGLADTPNL